MTTDIDAPDPYPSTAAPPARRRALRHPRLTMAAAGLVVVLGAGAGAAAVAQASTSSTASTTTTTVQKTPAPGTRLPGFRGGPNQVFRFGVRSGTPALGGPSALGGPIGFMGAIHALYTVADPSGGYETFATQSGTAESVSANSITVKSADGHAQSYVVGSSTLVDADYQGIGSVQTGDTVTVLALVSGSTYTAQTVTDTTQVQANRASWAPGPPWAHASTTTTTTTSAAA